MTMPAHALPAVPLARRSPLTLLRELAALIKPRITASSTLAAAAGMATHGQGWLSLSSGVSLAGIAACVAAACTFNMWLERDSDGLMERTRGRPLPSGKLEAPLAFFFACGLGTAGLLVLSVTAAPLALALSLAALVLYAFAYTPLKRVTPAASLVGILPGAMPPVIGAAALSQITPLAWALAVMLALWQLPHLMAVALRLRDQYAAAKLHTLLDWLGEANTVRVLQWGLLALVPLAFLPLTASREPLVIAGSMLAALIALRSAVCAWFCNRAVFQSRRFILDTVIYVIPPMLACLAFH